MHVVFAEWTGGFGRGAEETTLLDRKRKGIGWAEKTRILELGNAADLRATLQCPRIGSVGPGQDPAMAMDVEGVRIAAHSHHAEAHLRI